MQPLLITSLVALLIALIKIRWLIYERADLAADAEYEMKRANDWYLRAVGYSAKYDAQVNLVNKLQVDNALLVASLKRKHLRVPKL